MMVFPSNRAAVVEITASSFGGAFLIVYALGLYAGESFLTPQSWKAFGVLTAAAAVAAIVTKADRRAVVLSLVMAAAAFSGSVTIRSHAFMPIAFMTAASVVFLGYLLWFYRESFGPVIGLSGAVAGAVLLWFLTAHFLRATNSFVLVGAGIAYIMGRRGIREGKDPVKSYRVLFLTTMFPCLTILAIGSLGHGKWLYPAAALFFVLGVGLSHVEAD
ncbi:MAG: hypothetical protein GXO69_06775 [Acidobacteria bacterium]|nr:hypothetical protein [Acidobacteriota bacterium]